MAGLLPTEKRKLKITNGRDILNSGILVLQYCSFCLNGFFGGKEKFHSEDILNCVQLIEEREVKREWGQGTVG